MILHVDRAAFAAAFAHRLRRAGVAVAPQGVDAFIRALEPEVIRDRRRLYWIARITLLDRQQQLATFEAVFAAVFCDAVPAVDPNARRQPQPASRGSHASVNARTGLDAEGDGLPWVTWANAVAPSAADPSGPAIPERHPSMVPAAAEKAFDDLDEADVEVLADWIRRRAMTWPTRRTRRQHSGSRGRRLDLRATLALTHRTAGEPIELVRRHPVRHPRPVIVVGDVSQSMQHQVTTFLHLMRATAPLRRSEVFVFSTSLTRLTTVLKHHSAAVAVAQASELVTDRYGGTRIASSLQALMASIYGSRIRGGIIVIASDGWDADPPEALAAVMRRLHRRAYRVIWVNPRISAPGFVPEVGSMAAALPYCDDFLPGHDVSSLLDLFERIAALRTGSGNRTSATG